MTMQTKDYHDFVKQIATTHPNILGTGIINNGRLVSSFAKPEAPTPPKEQKLAFMFAQAHLLVEIPKTNEDYFGKVRYTMIEHDRLHVFLFPLKTILIKAGERGSKNSTGKQDEEEEEKEDEFRGILFVIAHPPYSHEELINKVSGYLKTSKNDIVTET